MIQIFDKYGKLKTTTSSGGGSSIWGDITGTVVNQTDLTNYLSTTYFPIPIGTVSQYIRGNGSLATFPTIIPSALTRVNDTNITATFTGTPGSALLQEVGITLGWTGTLDDSRITNATTWNNKITSLDSGGGISIGGTTTVPIITNIAPDQTVVLSNGTGINISGTYPNFTITNTAPSSGGTVTNVSALTLGTLGNDLNSSVVNNTTTPIITLNVPTASSSNRGVLSSIDWDIFNNKQNQLNGNGFVKTTGTTISYDNSIYLTTISGLSAGGELSGTYPNPTLLNSAVVDKLLTGLNVTGGSVVDTDSILIAFGKTQNQINGLLGGATYQGIWNANTNLPTIISSIGTKGHYRVVNVAGNTNIDGITDWKVGDWIIFNGITWDKVDNTDAVSSVNGFVGAVSLTTADVLEITNLYYTEARVNANTNVAANTTARHNALTLGTANGLSLSTQALSLQLASTSQNGALSNTDWNTFNNKQNAITPSALTKTDDTNITITLGGNPTTALLQATSITVGWSGTLADGRIASASTWNAKQDALISGTSIKTVNSTSLLGSGNLAVQEVLVSGTNIKTVNGNSLLGAGNIVISGGVSEITDTLTFTFINEDNFVVNTVSSALLTTANFKGFSIIPQETTATTLDDYSLNGVTFNIESIVNNTSFNIRASASNGATGVYTIIYKIIYQ